MRQRTGKQFMVMALMLLIMPSSFDGKLMKTDGCPKLILTIVCDSQNDEGCCPKFVAEAGGNFTPDVEKVHFNWSVSNGKIISGQGTPIIRFDTGETKEKLIEIKLKVEGLNDWPAVCPKEISLSIDKCKEKEKSVRT